MYYKIYNTILSHFSLAYIMQFEVLKFASINNNYEGKFSE